MYNNLSRNNIINNKYKIIEKLGEGGMSTVYKAFHKEKNKEVAIKFLKPGVTSSYVEDIIRFKKEIEVVSILEHPYIVKAYETGEYNNLPYIVTEVLHGENLKNLIFKNQFGIDKSVFLIKQLAEALDYVHNKNIIHRDIKPGNIILEETAKSYSVKLLDFGLSQLMELSAIKGEKEIAGTFAYMSPEATGIIKKSIDERSDLYSLGIVFYELLTGKLPFKGRDIGSILHQQVAVEPIKPTILNRQISKELNEIVLKLLFKDQELRYQSAKGLIYDLDRYIEGEKDFIIGQKDQKRKLTYQTRLIGREEEFNQIKKMYEDTTRHNGSICFIGGDPGVGKTRLVDEIQDHVYKLGFESGGLFIRGRCLNQENKIPYQPFKDALNEYINKFNMLEEEAKQQEKQRIKEIVGELGGIVIRLNKNMESILGDTPELTPLEPEKENQRFIIVVSDFFCKLGKKGGSCMLFLDDLQWADEGSLRLVSEINMRIDQSNLMIVGTYRDNEVSEEHTLTKIKKSAEEKKYKLIDIKLKTLTKLRLGKMISHLLGEDEKKVIKLTEYILEKSSGNPFFAITLLRELVEEKALIWQNDSWEEDWEKINKMRIPANVIDMVLLKIKDISRDLDQLLRIGSVIGREYEVEMLYDLVDLDKQEVVNLVDEAIDLQLLEYSRTKRGKVLFIHDRIKEAFFSRMGEIELKNNHLEVAEIIERRYNNGEQELIFDLAHHYIQAEEKDKGLFYGILAGDKAKEDYANREAIKYYKYSRKLLEEKDLKNEEYVKLVENLGDVQRLEGIYEEALENFKRAERLVTERLYKARINQKIGDTLFGMGKVLESINVLQKTLKILKFKIVPKSLIMVLFKMCIEFIIQILHFLFPVFFVNNKYKDNERMKLAARIYLRLGYSYYFSDFFRSGLAMFTSVNLSDKMKDTYEYSWVHSTVSAVWIIFKQFGIGEKYIKKAFNSAVKINSKLLEGLAYCYFCYTYSGAAKLDKAIESGLKSIEILLNLGERWELAVAYCFTLWPYYTKGEFVKYKNMTQEFLKIMKQVNDFLSLGWAVNFYYRALIFTQGGEIKNAVEDIKEAVEHEEKSQQPPYVVLVNNSLIIYYINIGEYDEAIETGEKGVEIFLHTAAKVYWASDVFAWTSLAYLGKIKTENLPKKEKNEYLRRVKFLTKKAIKWGKDYKIHYGLGLRSRARYYWLAGKKGKSIKYYKNAIRFTLKNQHKYELGLSQFELGKFLYEYGFNKKYNREKGMEYLINAKQIFQEIGANPYLKKTDELLGTQFTSNLSDDISTQDRLALERQMTTVLNTSRYLSSILDLDELLEKIMDKTIELVGAERGILLLYPEFNEDKECELEIRVLRNVKKGDLDKSFKVSKSIIQQAITKQKPLIIENASADKDFKLQDSIVTSKIKSVLCTPIISKKEILGIIYLDNNLLSNVFKEEDLKILELIGSQAGVSIENARLYKNLKEQERLKKEMEIAERIQTALIPDVPEHEELEVTAIMQPAEEVGGDYYDITCDKKNSLWLSIGDVSGHGVTPGLIMMMAQTSFSTIIREKDVNPKKALDKINFVLNNNIVHRLKESLFMTMQIFRYKGKGYFLCSGAAHPEVLIYRKSKKYFDLVNLGGVFLGVKSNIFGMIQEQEIFLNKDDIMVLYTDGIIESRRVKGRRELFGIHNLKRVIKENVDKSLGAIRDAILKEAVDWCGNVRGDDMTLILIRKK